MSVFGSNYDVSDVSGWLISLGSQCDKTPQSHCTLINNKENI